MVITSLNDSNYSLQITHMENLGTASKEFEVPVLIKATADCEAEILPAEQDEWISTKLYESWNPCLVKGIRNQTADVQIGY